MNALNSALLGTVRKKCQLRGQTRNLRTHASRNLLGYPVAYRDNLTAFIALRAVAFWVALSIETFGGLSCPYHCNVPTSQALKLSQEVREASFRRLQPLGFFSELMYCAISYNREVMGWDVASQLIVTLSGSILD